MFASDDGVVLSLQLRPSVQQVKQGETVELEVELHVVGESAVRVPSFLEPGTNIEALITGPNGQRIPYIVTHRDYAPLPAESFLRLESQHYLGRKMSVSPEHFGTQGTYVVKVAYDTEDRGSSAALSAWTGTLVSNKVIVVVE